uniref:Hic6 n=1 Tax=Sinohyriopsis cumingii TaxID=165450 RepID=A0A565DAE2_SINCU|nr:hic6 [Sinohyriopsis cumingii]
MRISIVLITTLAILGCLSDADTDIVLHYIGACIDWQGNIVQPGQSYIIDGCNRCQCTIFGLGPCTRVACPQV